MINATNISEFLDYDPESGLFTWKCRDPKWFESESRCRAWNTRYAGRPSGSLDGWGYIRVPTFNHCFKAHRLAWLWMTGRWPEHEIDHINHDKTDNRWTNLREVTKAENSRNLPRYRTNTSGVTGISWHKNMRKWQAYIRVEGKRKCLGFFLDKETAAETRRAAEIEYGYHENHGVLA